MLNLLLNIAYVILTGAALILVFGAYLDHLEMQRFLKIAERNSIANAKKWAALNPTTKALD